MENEYIGGKARNVAGKRLPLSCNFYCFRRSAGGGYSKNWSKRWSTERFVPEPKYGNASGTTTPLYEATAIQFFKKVNNGLV